MTARIMRCWPICLFVLTLGTTGCDSPGVVGKKVGNLAPEISGVDADGKTHRLADYRGKVVYVSFWGTWCPPCRALLPHEKELVLVKYRDRPFAMLGIAADSPDALKEFQQRNPLPWPNIVDGRGGPIATNWEIEAYPSGILVDHRGVIRGFWPDGINPAEVDRLIERLVSEAEADR